MRGRCGSVRTAPETRAVFSEIARFFDKHLAPKRLASCRWQRPLTGSCNSPLYDRYGRKAARPIFGNPRLEAEMHA
ncbi:hypothetical protein FV233_18935 [Methylobacterium sp. WL7]|nr:hypothetical protein FV233_18935 [Methylobacterium sp. WL7]